MATDDAYGVSTEGVHSADFKWYGITALGAKVYAQLPEPTPF